MSADGVTTAAAAETAHKLNNLLYKITRSFTDICTVMQHEHLKRKNRLNSVEKQSHALYKVTQAPSLRRACYKLTIVCGRRDAADVFCCAVIRDAVA